MKGIQQSQMFEILISFSRYSLTCDSHIKEAFIKPQLQALEQQAFKYYDSSYGGGDIMCCLSVSYRIDKSGHQGE